MANGDIEIPSVQIYVKDRVLLTVLIATQIGLFIAGRADSPPVGVWSWVVFVGAMIGAVGTQLAMRLVATPRQAGAMRVADEALRRMSDKDAKDIIAEAQVPRPN